MRWIFALVIIAASSIYLYFQYFALTAPPPPPPSPPALVQKGEPAPFLSASELKSVRLSTEDGDSGVRWSAIELLFTIKDPESLRILEKAVSEDPDPEVRMKAVHLLNMGGTSRQVPGLIKALNDLDKDVRIAALKALADIADPAAAPWVAALLKDPESEVKTEALHTLGKFQDKRQKDFELMTDQLRLQYEAAVKKSQQNSQ